MTAAERQVIITAVGPDNKGLADPIVHFVTEKKANICEIQMFNRDQAGVFAMLLRAEWPASPPIEDLRNEIRTIGVNKGLSIRVWPQIVRHRTARLAVCVTKRPETPGVILQGIADGKVPAEVAVMIGNRDHCQSLAEKYGVPFVNIGDAEGRPDNEQFLALLDQHSVDYVVLARYMRILPPQVCWSYAGGRIINLHHGLLPAYPGARPYSDAFAHHILTYGATAHFIIPELDEGNQIIHQTSFTVEPGTPLDEIVKRGQTESEPACIAEAVRRVVVGEVGLHFHRVIKL